MLGVFLQLGTTPDALTRLWALSISSWFHWCGGVNAPFQEGARKAVSLVIRWPFPGADVSCVSASLGSALELRVCVHARLIRLTSRGSRLHFGRLREEVGWGAPGPIGCWIVKPPVPPRNRSDGAERRSGEFPSDQSRRLPGSAWGFSSQGGAQGRTATRTQFRKDAPVPPSSSPMALPWGETVKDLRRSRSYVKRVRDVRVDANRRAEIERLFRERRGRMWQAVFAFAGDPEIASDAVAEAFAQALNRGEAIRSPEPWLWRTVFRIAAGELKNRGPQVAERFDNTCVPKDPNEVDDLARDLVVALAKLSEKQRAAVVLHHVVGYPVKDVAEILSSTTPAVYVHLSRARKRLRELLRTEDG